MTKRKPAKPVREMTNDELAEWLLGKAVVREVKRELEEPEPPEKPDKTPKNSPTKGKDT